MKNELEPWERWPRECWQALVFAMQDADRAYEEAGAAGTKTYVRDFLIPELDRLGFWVTEKQGGEG